MTTTQTILLIGTSALVVYLCRLSGFIFTRLTSSRQLERFLHFTPIAVFSALLVPSVIREPELLGSKLIALAVAGLVMRYTKQFGLGIFVGFALFWLLTWFGI